MTTKLSAVAKPARAPVCGLTYPILRTSEEEAPVPLMPPQALSSGAAPIAAAPRPPR
ncbi:hypothetical protein ACFQ0B_41990 [Nonomuraea thailandensis]